MTNPLKVLIIEDDLLIAQDIQEKLLMGGHEVTAIARNYQQAMAVIEKQLPDIALVDVHLEDSSHDGISTIKELLTFHQMPLIYLTGHSEPDTIARAKETRPSAYLLKPFRAHELSIQLELAYANSKSPEATDNTDSDFMYLPFNKGYEKLTKNEVIYLQAYGAYVNAYLLNETQPKLFSMNLGHIAKYFTSPHFYRLSRSLLINLSFIERIEREQLWMRSQSKPIYIPETKRAEMMKRLVVVKTPR